MSSIQYGLPLATNKVMSNVDNTRIEILNRMNTYRTASEKVFDYYVEPVYIEGRQEYMVSFVYINNIHVIGKLCTKDTSDLQPIVGDTIPNTVLVRNKLYSSTGCPYKIRSYASGDEFFKMTATDGGVDLYIALATFDVSTLSGGMFRLTYNHTLETMTYNGGDQDNLPEKIYKSVYIPYSQVIDSMSVFNDIYYMDYIPITKTEEVKCYQVTL